MWRCVLRKGNEIAYNQTNPDASQTQFEFWEGEAVQPLAKASERRDASQTYRRRCMRRMRVALQVSQRGVEKSRV